MGNGAVVPLSGRSVFVTASEQHDINGSALERLSTASSLTTQSIGTATASGLEAATAEVSSSMQAARPSTSTPKQRPSLSGHRRSISNSFSQPRRSRAHQPTLLGLGIDEIGVSNDVEGNNEAREAVMLTGLGIHANANTTPPRAAKLSASSLARAQATSTDEDQFRIGSDTEEINGGEESLHDESKHASSLSNGGHASIDRTADRTYGGPEEDDERTLFGYEQDYDDDEDVEAGLRGTNVVKLPFEATTGREKIWMWTSVALVVALSTVSLAIAVDWIDWPGDGIGKQR